MRAQAPPREVSACQRRLLAADSALLAFVCDRQEMDEQIAGKTGGESAGFSTIIHRIDTEKHYTDKVNPLHMVWQLRYEAGCASHAGRIDGTQEVLHLPLSASKGTVHSVTAQSLDSSPLASELPHSVVSLPRISCLPTTLFRVLGHCRSASRFCLEYAVHEAMTVSSLPHELDPR